MFEKFILRKTYSASDALAYNSCPSKGWDGTRERNWRRYGRFDDVFWTSRMRWDG